MDTDLILLTWPDYINPRTLEQFEAELGARVKVEVVPSAVEMMERMRMPDAPPDVLCPPDYAVRALNAEGRLWALDHSRIPNLQHLEPRFRHGRAHDPDSRVSVVKDWGTTGFMYRTDVVKESPQAWADFWRLAERQSGKVTVLDSPGEVIGAALKLRGHSYNATDAEALEQARRDLLKLKPHLRAFETNYRPLLASGEACLALGWNGDAAALNAEGVPVQYVVPSEGSQFWEDDWAIAASAPHPETAHAFLNFVLRPEVAAQEARYTRYATGNRAALALLDEALRHDPSLYPPPEVIQKLEPGMPLDPEGSARREAVWKEVRG
ncbi:MAG TPA: spermidine/putrescine ABC transporter substrate-binding protein [Anaerolineales bacterium]|nr:spermidine/putrescine ABC transporter substrate-binding protein [Anaerolineales bacterium]